MTAPVAGFSTGISAPCPRPFVLCAVVVSTLAISLLLNSTSRDTLAGSGAGSRESQAIACVPASTSTAVPSTTR